MPKKENVEIYMAIIGADDARIDIEKVRKALEDYGDEGVKIAGPVTNALKNIQKGWDGVADKITNGKAVTQKDVAVMVQQYTFLEQAIGQAFGSAANAPKELQAALGKAETQLKSVTKAVGQLDDAVKDNAANVKIAGDQWPGLGNAIEAVGGKMGTVVAKLGLIAGAFKEGWSTGMQFNQFVGTDMSEWDKVAERIGSKFKVVFASMSDSVIAFGNYFAAIFSGDLDTFGAAFTEFAKTSKKALGDLGDAVTKYGAEWDKLHPRLSQIKAAKELAAEAAKKLAEENEKAAAAAKKHAEEQARLKEKIDDVTEALKKNADTIEALEKKQLEADGRIFDRSGAMKQYASVVQDVSAQVAAQKAEVEGLTQKYGENDPMVLAARDRLENLQAALVNATKSYEGAKAEVAKFEDQHKSATTQLVRAHEETGKLGEKLVPLQAEYNKVGAAATASATVQQTASAAVAESTDKATTKVEGYRDAQGKLHIVSVEVAKDAQAAGDSIATVGDKAAQATTALNKIGEASGPKTAEMEILRMVDALDTAIDRAITLRSELEKIAELGDDDGGGDGGETSKSSSPAPAASSKPAAGDNGKRSF